MEADCEKKDQIKIEDAPSYRRRSTSSYRRHIPLRSNQNTRLINKQWVSNEEANGGATRALNKINDDLFLSMNHSNLLATQILHLPPSLRSPPPY